MKNSRTAHTRKMIVLRLDSSCIGDWRSVSVRDVRGGAGPAVAFGGEPYQRGFHIVKETDPLASGHTAAGDEHIIEAGTRQVGQEKPGGLAHAALGPVALDGPADAAGGGEAGPHQRLFVGAGASLDHYGAAGAR